MMIYKFQSFLLIFHWKYLLLEIRMPADANGKNTLSHNNNSLIQDIHFAVCPYVVQNFDSIQNLFTLNFEKENQIVGQLSTMICSQQQKHKVDIDMMKNIMFFRIFKDKMFKYKWSVYQRDMKGREKIVQSININVEKEVQQFVKSLKKSRNNSSARKNSINQSRTLSVSSKVNQSRQKQKQKSKQIAINKRKKSLKNLQIETSRESRDEKSQQGIHLKQMKSKFVKSGILLGFILCMGLSEDQIRANVKRFHLQSKLKIVSKSLEDKNVDIKIENNDTNQLLKQVIEDREEQVNSNKNIEDIPIQQPVKKQKIQEKQWSLKNGQLPLFKQEILKKYSQHQIQQYQTQPKNTLPFQQNHKKSQPQKSSQQSLLDDVILRGKRFSVEQKSDWMKTSKSKTQEPSQNINISSNFLNPSKKQQSQPKLLFKLSKNLQLVSRNFQNQNQAEDIINSLKPVSNNNDPQNNQNYIQDAEFVKMRKNLSQTGNDNNVQCFQQNYLNSKQIKVRRKFTPDEYHAGLSRNSPSSMNIQIKINQQNPVKTSNNKTSQIKFQQNNRQRQNEDLNKHHVNQLFYQQSPNDNDDEIEHHSYQQVITPGFNQVQVTTKNYTQSNDLFAQIQKAWKVNQDTNQIKLQIKQTIDIPAKQAQVETNTKKDQNIKKDIINNCQIQEQQILWGNGLSQIKYQQHVMDSTQQINQEEEEEDFSLQKFYYQHIRPYHEKYVLPLQQNIQQKISQNQHSQKLITYLNNNRNFKYILCVFIIILVFFMINGLIGEEAKVLSRNDPIFKKKTNKVKRQKYKKKR